MKIAILFSLLILSRSLLASEGKDVTCKVTSYLRTGLLSTAWTPGRKKPVVNLEECVQRAKDDSLIAGKNGTRFVQFTYDDGSFKISGRVTNKD